MSSLGLQATGAALEAIDRHVPALVQDRFASRLSERDATLWGPAAEDEASRRLGWMTLFEDSRDAIFISGPSGEILDVNPTGPTTASRRARRSSRCSPWR